MKQVIVMRTDLNMRKGKMIAQGAHASLTACIRAQVLNDPRYQHWLDNGMKKICVGIGSAAELVKLYTDAENSGIVASLILDQGLTEFNEETFTAVAIGPADDEAVDEFTRHLKLL